MAISSVEDVASVKLGLEERNTPALSTISVFMLLGGLSNVQCLWGEYYSEIPSWCRTVPAQGHVKQMSN